MTLELTDPQPVDRAQEILSPGALAFVDALHQRFAGRRKDLLAARREQRTEAAPPALQDRRVEMTGPAKRLVSDLCLSDDFVDFLTLPAYELVK